MRDCQALWLPVSGLQGEWRTFAWRLLHRGGNSIRHQPQEASIVEGIWPVGQDYTQKLGLGVGPGQRSSGARMPKRLCRDHLPEGIP